MDGGLQSNRSGATAVIDGASGYLSIDLGALARNYEKLAAEVAPARVTRMPLLPEPDGLLDDTQLGRLKHMVRHGGFASLETGHQCPINVAVHRTRPAQGVTVIASIGSARPRTKCFTVRGDERECLKRLLISIEDLHIIATPQRAAAA